MRVLLVVFSIVVGGMFGSPPSVFGQDALSVTSSTDGNGLYTYTFSKGSQPYVWGLSTTTAIYLQSYGVLETSQPTNWTANFDGSGRIVWSVANGIAFLDAPVTVSVRSIFKTSRMYTNWGDDPIVFRQGFVLGQIYDITNHTVLGEGVENFASVGPDPTALTIRQTNSSVVVSWYSGVSNSQLQATGTLLNSNSWIAVTNVPVIVGDRNFVTNSVSASPRFYRLKF